METEWSSVACNVPHYSKQAVLTTSYIIKNHAIGISRAKRMFWTGLMQSCGLVPISTAQLNHGTYLMCNVHFCPTPQGTGKRLRGGSLVQLTRLQLTSPRDMSRWILHIVPGMKASIMKCMEKSYLLHYSCCMSGQWYVRMHWHMCKWVYPYAGTLIWLCVSTCDACAPVCMCLAGKGGSGGRKKGAWISGCSIVCYVHMCTWISM